VTVRKAGHDSTLSWDGSTGEVYPCSCISQLRVKVLRGPVLECSPSMPMAVRRYLRPVVCIFAATTLLAFTLAMVAVGRASTGRGHGPRNTVPVATAFNSTSGFGQWDQDFQSDAAY
jgi:hypothetical protein